MYKKIKIKKKPTRRNLKKCSNSILKSNVQIHSYKIGCVLLAIVVKIKTTILKDELTKQQHPPKNNCEGNFKTKW